MAIKKKLTRIEIQLLMKQLQRYRAGEIQKEAVLRTDDYIRKSVESRMATVTPEVTAKHLQAYEANLFNKIIAFFKKKMGR